MSDISSYVQHIMNTHPGSNRHCVQTPSRTYLRQMIPAPVHSHAEKHRRKSDSHAPTMRTAQQHRLRPYSRPRHKSQPDLSTPTQPSSSRKKVQPLTHTTPAVMPESVQRALSLAWAPSTMERYNVNINEYIAFCDSERVAEADRLPASELMLAMFAASLVGWVAGPTISAKISAVKAWHIQNGKPWKGGLLLQYVLKGAANATPEKSKQERRLPVTFDMLVELSQGLDLTSNLDVAVYAVATIAFYGQMRLGEICADREAYNTFNCKTLPNLSHLRPPHSPAGSRILHIPWTKVKRVKGEDIAICRQQDITDPINALQNHLRINAIEHPDIAIPSYTTSTGTRKLLTVSKFTSRCNAVWATHNRPRYTGHCFRIGGTTHYLLTGVNPDVVRVTGRWSSDAFIRYWRQLDVVATVHTENLHLNNMRRYGRSPAR